MKELEICDVGEELVACGSTMRILGTILGRHDFHFPILSMSEMTEETPDWNMLNVLHQSIMREF